MITARYTWDIPTLQRGFAVHRRAQRATKLILFMGIVFMGWVYRDKPMFLTAPAALFAAIVWAIFLYLFLCILRYFIRRRA